MDNRIEIDNFEDRVRAKLGVAEPYLSDEDINFPDIRGVAELNITSLFPDFEDFEGDDLVYLGSILVLESCILLSPSMSARLPKKELGPHARHELWINWDRKKEEYINERDNLMGRLDDLLNPDLDMASFKSFGVTYPRRGW